MLAAGRRAARCRARLHLAAAASSTPLQFTAALVGRSRQAAGCGMSAAVDTSTEAVKANRTARAAAMEGGEAKACTLPCEVVGRDEPAPLRNGTPHTRLDGSRGSDKCVQYGWSAS